MPNALRRGAQPRGRALDPEREQRRQVRRAAILKRQRGVAEERLGEEEARVRPDRREVGGAARRQGEHRRDAELGKDPAELVLDDVGQRADDQERLRRVGGGGGHRRHQRGEARVLALGEGRLDAAARIVEDAGARRMLGFEAAGGARQVELDHLRRARPDEEQQFDLGPPREQPVDDSVEFLVGVGKAGEVALLDDRGGETRLGEDHDARGGLQQMGAGPAADDEEERVLDLAVEPDDAGQAAEYLALAALAQHRRQRGGVAVEGGDAHAATIAGVPAAVSSRAARSLRMNCAALMT